MITDLLSFASVRAMVCCNIFACCSSSCSSMNLSGVNVSTFPNQSSKCSLFPALFLRNFYLFFLYSDDFVSSDNVYEVPGSRLLRLNPFDAKLMRDNHLFKSFGATSVAAFRELAPIINTLNSQHSSPTRLEPWDLLIMFFVPVL